MIYLLNALPNSLISDKTGTIIRPVTAKAVAYAVSSPDYYEDFDDNIPPSLFSAVSAVGHESTAEMFTRLLAEHLPQAFHAFKPITTFKVPVNRITVIPQKGDTVFCGLFTPPRRLGEGEKWTEEEILQCPINWVCIQY